MPFKGNDPSFQAFEDPRIAKDVVKHLANTVIPGSSSRCRPQLAWLRAASREAAPALKPRKPSFRLLSGAPHGLTLPGCLRLYITTRLGPIGCCVHAWLRTHAIVRVCARTFVLPVLHSSYPCIAIGPHHFQFICLCLRTIRVAISSSYLQDMWLLSYSCLWAARKLHPLPVVRKAQWAKLSGLFGHLQRRGAASHA